MKATFPYLGLVTGVARPAPCPTCSVVVELAEVRYRVEGGPSAHFWSQARHDCVPKRPVAAEFCADPYCEDEQHAGGDP